MPQIPNGRPIIGDEPRLQRLTSLPLADTQTAAQELQSLHASPQEFGPAFARLSATEPDAAGRFSTAFVASLETRDELAQLFDEVARAPAADRLAILAANRGGDAGLRVVHAVSALPEAQGTIIMRDFLTPNGQTSDEAFGSVAAWLAEAGAELRRRGIPVAVGELPHDG